jgi:hypothetical protein
MTDQHIWIMIPGRIFIRPYFSLLPDFLINKARKSRPALYCQASLHKSGEQTE